MPAFVSLLLRLEVANLPGIPAAPNKVRGTMRLDAVLGEQEQCTEKLGEQ